MFAAPLRAGIAMLFVLAFTMTAPATLMAEDDAPDTPLQARARALLGGFSQAQTKDAQITIREQLAAMADTLEVAGEDALASQCLERAGIAGYRLAEYDSARELWTRGLAVARRSGDKKRIAALLNAQAIGVSITGDNEGAIVLQTELVAMRRELEDVRGEGISWHNLAFSYFALFKYPEAIEALSNALRLHREAGNAFALAGSMGTLANALFEVGQVQDAMAMADSAVARSRDLGDPSVLGQALQSRARQLHYAGRFDESLADFEDAHDVLTAAGVARVAAVSDLNRANALISLERCDDARRVIDAATEVLAPIGSQEEILWGDCVRARITARCGNSDDARAALVATIDRLETTRDSIPDELNRADAFRMAGGAYTDLALLEIAGHRPEDAWLAVESSTARVFGEEIGADGRSTLAQLQKRLAEMDGVALQFGHSTVDRNVACVVTPTAIHAFPVVIGPGFRDDVGAALRLMSSGASDDDCRPALERIADVALKPAGDVLSDAGQRLIVFPGDLAGFPIDALPLPGSGGTTIGDRFAVTYAPSATAFLALEARGSRGTSVVVFADPDVGTPAEDSPVVAMRAARMTLAPLPHARAEGEAVGKSGTLLLGPDATRSAFLERAADAGVVHVAAHAVVDGAHPDYSGVVLAGDDGGDMVTASDLRNLSLGADLVSLSGCATAGGYIATGDGAFGLTRAFLVAGARSVVSSWWDVEDAAARRFMELYYEALRDGADRDVALQIARRTMAKKGYTHRDRSAFAIAGATAQPVAALTRASSGPGRGIAGGGAAMLVVLIAVAARRRRRRAT